MHNLIDLIYAVVHTTHEKSLLTLPFEEVVEDVDGVDELQ